METFNLNKAAKRNLDRFPQDFMFQLTKEEVTSLASKLESQSRDVVGAVTCPIAFTEHGVAMLPQS